MKLCGQVDSWTFKKRCDIAPGLGRFLFFQRLLVRSNLCTVELMCLMIFFIIYRVVHPSPQSRWRMFPPSQKRSPVPECGQSLYLPHHPASTPLVSVSIDYKLASSRLLMHWNHTLYSGFYLGF